MFQWCSNWISGNRSAGYGMRTIGELFLPPVFLTLLYSLARSPQSSAARALCWSPLGYLGKISYCMYVLHIPLLKYYFWATRGEEFWTIPLGQFSSTWWE